MLLLPSRVFYGTVAVPSTATSGTSDVHGADNDSDDGAPSGRIVEKKISKAFPICSINLKVTFSCHKAYLFDT